MKIIKPQKTLVKRLKTKRAKVELSDSFNEVLRQLRKETKEPQKKYKKRIQKKRKQQSKP